MNEHVSNFKHILRVITVNNSPIDIIMHMYLHAQNATHTH